MKLSAHARERMAEMDVDADEVYETIRHPEMVYPSLKYRGAETFVRGRIAVAVRGKRIVTVLWNGREERGYRWQHPKKSDSV